MQLPDKFNWKRFWARQGQKEKPHIDINDYLADMGEHLPGHKDKRLIELPDLMNTPVLVLLGEAGSGKSTELHDLQSSILNQGTRNSTLIDLGAHTSAERLERTFERDDRIQNWISVGGELDIFFDSFDEARIRIDLLVDELGKILRPLSQKQPAAVLRIRFSSRHGAWAEQAARLSSVFREICKLSANEGDSEDNDSGSHAIEILELQPLRKSDVLNAARLAQVDANMFWEALEKTGQHVSARNPLLLRSLLSAFANGGLPDTRIELERRACERLCEPTRRGELPPNRISTGQRFELAARVAVITNFSGKNGVYAEQEFLQHDHDSLRISDLKNDADDDCRYHCPGGQEGALRQVLNDTGLFRTDGDGKYRWEHRQREEFLAAWHLHVNSVSVKKILGLCRSEYGIAPQHYGILGWAADLIPELRAYLIKSNPEIILDCDVHKWSEASRQELVDSLIDSYSSGRLNIWRDTGPEHFHKLMYPGLAVQLRDCIVNRKCPAPARIAAIQMANECELNDLSSDIADIAYNVNDDYDVRTIAAGFIADIGDTANRKRLFPVPKHTAPAGDGFESFRGNCLRAVWPSNVTPSELLATLTRPSDTHAYGSYRSFLEEHLIQDSTSDALIELLNWIESGKWEQLIYEPYYFKGFIEPLLVRAAEYIENQKVAESLARAFMTIAKRQHVYGVSGKAIDLPAKKRREVVRALLPYLNEAFLNDDYCLDLVATYFDLRSDFQWLSEQYLATSPGNLRDIYQHLVFASASWWDPIQWETLRKLCATDPVIKKNFARQLELIGRLGTIGNCDAQCWAEGLNTLPRSYSRQNTQPPKDAEKEVAQLVQKIRLGDTNAWNSFRSLLSLSPSVGTSPPHSDVWRMLPKPLQREVATAGIELVTNIQTNGLQEKYADLIADVAFTVGAVDTGLLSVLPTQVFTDRAALHIEWVAIGYSRNDKLADRILTAIRGLLGSSYASAVRDALASGTIPFSTAFVRAAWDPTVCDFFVGRLSPALNGDTLDETLRILLEKNVERAQSWCREQISKYDPARHDIQVRIASLLFRHRSDDFWTLVWPQMRAQEPFGRAVTERCAGRVHLAGPGFSGQPPDRLGDLYIWLSEKYPIEEDPQHSGGFAPGPRDHVADWRRLLLEHLVEAGEIDIVQSIRSRLNGKPEYSWLSRRIEEARRNRRELRWQPLSPKAILEITLVRDSRFVRSEQDLLDIVLEAFDSYQIEIKNGLVTRLWTQTDSNEPKHEKELSRELAGHLRNMFNGKFVAASRDPEIGPLSDSPDLLVTAFDEQGNQYNLVVEVKGSWHREWHTSLEDQLLRQYLTDKNCSIGIYLLGWFHCAAWKPNGSRHATNIDQARALLNRQAQTHSTNGIQIRSFVLDAEYPVSESKNRRQSKQTRSIRRPNKRVGKKAAARKARKS